MFFANFRLPFIVISNFNIHFNHSPIFVVFFTFYNILHNSLYFVTFYLFCYSIYVFLCIYMSLLYVREPEFPMLWSNKVFTYLLTYLHKINIIFKSVLHGVYAQKYHFESHQECVSKNKYSNMALYQAEN